MSTAKDHDQQCRRCGADEIPPSFNRCPQCGASLARLDDIRQNGRKLFLYGLGAVFVFAALMSIFGKEKATQAPKPARMARYNFKHETSVNQYGVQFYYFRSTNAPPIHIANGQVNIAQVNVILSKIGEGVVASQPSSTVGRDSLVWKNYNNGSLVVEMKLCPTANRTGAEYICVKKVRITPSARTMMENQARNSATRLFVSQEMYGVAWPFTVDFGILACRHGGEVVFRTVDHDVYALNGLAKSNKALKDLRGIWKNDPTIPGLKISVGPLITSGLNLCD